MRSDQGLTACTASHACLDELHTSGRVEVESRWALAAARVLSLLGIGFVILCLSPNLSRTEELDTLREFDAKSISAFYRGSDIDVQAARFDLRAPAHVKEVTIWLAGTADSGGARVTIYGNEAGVPAPLIARPLARAMVTKTRRGPQAVTVRIEGAFVDAPQFFVAVDQLSPGVVLLSDRRERRPRCLVGSQGWYSQAVRRNDGRWFNGHYSFAIAVIVEYRRVTAPSYLSDATRDLGLEPDIVANRSIAWGDVDDDAWLDVLFGGRLFRNVSGDRFEDITERSALPTGSAPVAHVMLDVDNDRDLDLLFLGKSNDAFATLYLNDGRASFARVGLDVDDSLEPAAVTVADANLDGYVDVFVGGVRPGGHVAVGLLMLNDGRGGFLPDYTRVDSLRSLSGAQWVDIDIDGDPDLYVTGLDPRDTRLWLNDGTGRFMVASERIAAPAKRAELESPGDWADADGDGSLELLRAQILDLQSHSEGPTPIATDAMSSGLDRSLTATTHPVEYRHWSGGATWADVNNDGLADALVTSGCDCAFAALYLQREAGHFEDASFDYGLFRVPAGNDGVWVDFDNDGRLDLATFIGGRFAILRNTANVASPALTLDLSRSPSPASAICATATASFGGKRVVSQSSSGRGALMQGPPVIYLGERWHERPDSIMIRWAGRDGRTTQIETMPDRYRYALFTSGGGLDAAASDVTVDATPNPFSTSLALRFTLRDAAHVRIEIYSPSGSIVGVPADERLHAGEHIVAWKAVDDEGHPLPPGTYIYRVRAGSATATGRAVLVD